jgi:ABC-type phosphate transport system substrate-binding protein
MSQTQSAPRWGGRARVAGLLALAATALAAFGPASPASAAFTTGKCAGPNIIGRGGSFARDAHTVFNFNFKNLYCAGTPGAGSINVTYEPLGSGAGVKAVELRTDTPRFGQSDDPPTPSEVALMNSGGIEEGGKVVADSIATDNGAIHVFPVAVGAVAALVNFPDGCNPELLKDEYRTVSKAEIEGTPAKKGLLRVRFPKAKFEKIWAGEENAKWSEAFPELTGAACEVGITRVVRFDQSGTTFAFKDYLNSINGARGWKTTYATTAPLLTRAWPNAEFGGGGQCGATEAPGKGADNVDHLTTACANGNGELVKKLAATDGSIGYSDIATARNSSPSLAVDASKTEAPTTPYWTQVENGSSKFTEPTADEVSGFKTSGGSKGANCLTAEFKNVPANSFGSWANTSGVNAPSGYGICTMTYALAFDDNAAVWGNSPEEEAKARTVKDYLESAVSEAAQGQLFGADYAPLPVSILAISKAGVDEIGWNKSSEVGCPSCEGPTGNPGPKTTTTPPAPTAPPSNQFSLLKKTISAKTGGATLSVKLPGAGKLDVLGTAKAGKKKITVGHVVLNAGKGGTFSLTLKPSAAAKKVLAEKGKLSVTLKLTFSPTGGTENSSTSQVTLKMTQTSGKH